MKHTLARNIGYTLTAAALAASLTYLLVQALMHMTS